MPGNTLLTIFDTEFIPTLKEWKKLVKFAEYTIKERLKVLIAIDNDSLKKLNEVGN